MHELLMPAGDIEKAQYALNYGADAIYIGPKAYSLRARSSNFDFKNIKTIADYINKLQKKLYLALNIICHNSDMHHFAAYFQRLNQYKIDAIIAADPFIITTIQKINPKMEIHLSTQQSVTNSKACLFWHRNKVQRVVLAREVSYKELKLLLKRVANRIEIEYFIHGAVCIAYSGRCTMSNNFSLRDANVGGCAQSCRWQYEVTNLQTNKTFTMSPKDMALLPYFDQLLALNIASFKVEGRMKSIHYVATVANCYKKFISDYEHQQVNKPLLVQELAQTANRLVDVAWFQGKPDFNKMLYFELHQAIKQIFAFTIENQINSFTYWVKARNFFSLKTVFEIIYPNFQKQKRHIVQIYDQSGQAITKAKTPMAFYKVVFDHPITFQRFLIARSVYESYC